jgi:hypothetical protein
VPRDVRDLQLSDSPNQFQTTLKERGGGGKSTVKCTSQQLKILRVDSCVLTGRGQPALFTTSRPRRCVEPADGDEQQSSERVKQNARPEHIRLATYISAFLIDGAIYPMSSSSSSSCWGIEHVRFHLLLPPTAFLCVPLRLRMELSTT